MVWKFAKKFKNVICLVLMICIVIPLVSACGKSDNGLSTSTKNRIIGKGGNISAYTTYSQAKFMEMDQDMYYSYLMAYRDFILVVLPDKDGDGYVDNDNLMFQAAYNGVTPYSESFIGGNFHFENPEYKLVIYYVLASDLLAWDEIATLEEESGFVTKSFDVLGPVAELSNDVKVVNDKVKRMKYYTLSNLVNNNGYISECEFLYDLNKDIPSKCKKVEKKNIVRDVMNNDSEGLTLLYSNGGISGYFTYNDVKNYDVTNSTWINKLLEQYNKVNSSKVSMEGYLTNMIRENVCGTSLSYEYVVQESDICGNTREYVNKMLFKLKYDMALLGRIDKIHYNTVLDINTSTTVTTGVNESYQNNLNGYKKLLAGDTSVNNGNYITFTTADGFIIDRGNIMETGFIDALLDTNILSGFTMIDACTNRTLASYISEVLANVGIGVGGILVGAGAVMAVAGTLASVGLISSSVPVVGWIVGAACLLVAGIVTLAVSISTKKGIEETDSANYCEVYKEAIEEIIKMSYIKLPVYNYNIPEDANRTVDLCFAGQYVEENGVMVCKGKDGEEANLFEKTEAFKYADLDTVNQLSALSGAPSLRLYSNGKLVDEIYGSANPTFIYAIMDSWGVTAASSMKYYASLVKDDMGGLESINVYDLLAAADSEDRNEIVEATYCLSDKYGAECTSGKLLSGFDNNSFTDGIYTIDYLGVDKVIIDSMRDDVAASIREASKTRDPVNLESYIGDMKNIIYETNVINSTLEEGITYIQIDDAKMQVVRTSESFYIVESPDYNINIVEDGSDYKFGYMNKKYKLSINEDGSYSVINADLLEQSIDTIFGNMNEQEKISSEYYSASVAEFKNIVAEKKLLESQEAVNEYIDAYFTENIKNAVYYKAIVPIYFTISIKEKDNDGNISVVSSSVLYESYEYEITLGGDYNEGQAS